MRHRSSATKRTDPSNPRVGSAVALSKVADVTLAFWVIKLLTTGLGETASDFLVKTFDPVVVIPVCAANLCVALALQWLLPAFSKWRYWSAVSLVAVFGTMLADVVHVGLGVPYLVSTIFLLAALAVILFMWARSEGTFEVRAITTRRREFFYWTAVLVTFALGTSAGDLTATTLGLGYAGSAGLFLVAFILAIAAGRQPVVNPTVGFWLAYVLTRPLGASVADYLGAASARGGLELGNGPVSLELVLIALCVISMTRSVAARSADTRRDQKRQDRGLGTP